MKRLAWVNDIHLNFVSQFQIKLFCQEIMASAPEALLIAGDIGEAGHLRQHLNLLAALMPIPIYFVLGNHDFYGSSIAAVRQDAIVITDSNPQLHWLPRDGVVPLSDTTCLIGHDGWSDARIGDWTRSKVVLNDYRLIAELQGLNKKALGRKLNALGDEGADYFRQVLPQALDRFENVLMLIHPPPFREACWHQGNISNDDYLPHFTCKAIGEVARELMVASPDRRLTILCGHTHGGGTALILPNLLVKTGAADYGKPRFQEIIRVM